MQYRVKGKSASSVVIERESKNGMAVLLSSLHQFTLLQFSYRVMENNSSTCIGVGRFRIMGGGGGGGKA